jgi:hypothetical protein
MHCFVCDSAIERGDEITKCIEVEKMTLRRNRSVGQRWVHLMCVPKDCKTEYFMSVLKELKEDYPDLSDDYAYSIVADHDYWTHESSDYDSFKNLCMLCGEDMGPQNPRQLCGKYYCRNAEVEDDVIKVEDDDVIEDEDDVIEVEDDDVDPTTWSNLKSILKWYSTDHEQLLMEVDKKKLMDEKRKFDEAVDEALEILKRNPN